VNEVVARAVDHAASQAPTALVFVSDQDSEGVIRQSLNDVGVPAAQAEFIRGNVESATAALAQRASPRLLIIDIAGIRNPGAQLNELAKVCEPSTGVVAVGNSNDIRLYRELRNAGVAEYFFKPLVKSLVNQTCNSILNGPAPRPAARSGRLIFFLGVRGGVGATTLAVSTAWQLAEAHKRWVMFLDLDIYGGDAALQLDSTPSHALTEALERPERVDELFLDRGAIHVSQRLDLLAALEPLGQEVPIEEAAVLSLLNILVERYRFVFVDLPAALSSKLTQVLHLPSLCILVSDASIAAARDTVRWRERIGPNTSDRTTLHILNRNGAPGSLPEAEFARIVGTAPDLIVPYHRDIEVASTLGIKGIQSCATLRRSLTPIFRQLAGEGPPPPPSLFARLFG